MRITPELTRSNVRQVLPNVAIPFLQSQRCPGRQVPSSLTWEYCPRATLPPPSFQAVPAVCGMPETFPVSPVKGLVIPKLVI